MKVERKAVVIVVLAVVVGLVLYVPIAYLMPSEWRGWATALVAFVIALVAFLSYVLAVVERLSGWLGGRGERGLDLGSLRECLATHVSNQLTRQKNSKRYIPDVFVEVSRIKDQARLFAHPVLFLNRVIETISRLDFRPINRILLKLSQEPIDLQLPDGLESANTIEEAEHQSSCLSGVLGRVKNTLTDFSDPVWRGGSDGVRQRIPAEKRYIYDDMRYLLGLMALSLEFRIDRCTADLETIRSRVLFLVGRAGQGKTNFVCDFAENVLLKRSLPCLFFTGREFNDVDSDRLGEYLVNAVLGDLSSGDFGEMLEELERLSVGAQAPVTIIIDGINEHKNMGAFSHALERLVERSLRYKFVRFILTCRSEYFDERFANFRECSFADKICFVENFERHMTGAHKQHLVAAYFGFFNLRCPDLSQRAREVLETDTLLLRIFCEAYGDPAAQEVVVLPEVRDIYRDEMFRIYLRKKVEGAAEYGDRDPRLDVGLGIRYKRLLSRVVELMIERRQFVDIPVVDLGDEHQATLAEMLGEDVMVRKDLVEGRGVLDAESEVVSFTLDEFRDFLLADHLVARTFRRDPEGFKEIVAGLCVPESPVAEGVSRFIFYASKRPENRAVSMVIAQASWYRRVFLDCIFSVREDLIVEEDLREIQSRFHDTSRNSSRIIRSLIGRWRTDIYPVLNIRLLFQILDTLDVSGYERLVRPALEGDDLFYSYYGQPWPIDQLVDEVREILAGSGRESWPCSENLAELLVYLFDIRGGDGSFPAFTGFCHFADSQPDLAVGLLGRHTTIGNSRIAARVWEASAALASRGKVSREMVEEACRQLTDLGLSDLAEHQYAAGALARFLSTCESCGAVGFSDEIRALVQRFSYESIWLGD